MPGGPKPRGTKAIYAFEKRLLILANLAHHLPYHQGVRATIQQFQQLEDRHRKVNLPPW